VIKDNWIIGNQAIRRPSGALSAGGGGIRVGDGVPRILNNVIMSNSGMYGGGIVLNYTGAIVRNNVIARNAVFQAVSGAATFGGGGIWVSENFGNSAKIIENNTIMSNSSTGAGSQFAGRGGGILVGSTTATLRNNIIWGNTQSTGAQIGLIGGTAAVTFSDVEGGWAGAGNINQNPMTSDTSYYLLPNSLCIDAGDSNSVYNDPEDPGSPGFAQWPSRGGLRNDMGAYGGPGRHVLGNIVTSVREVPPFNIPTGYSLSQNFPNPFNPSTTIQFSLGHSGFATLKVFDTLGREVATLVSEVLAAGMFRTEWDATGVPSGVYFYRLSVTPSASRDLVPTSRDGQSNNFVQTRKLLIVK